MAQNEKEKLSEGKKKNELSLQEAPTENRSEVGGEGSGDRQPPENPHEEGGEKKAESCLDRTGLSRLECVNRFWRSEKEAKDKVWLAKKLHRRLKRMLHTSRNVVATDVGFLMHERDGKFLPNVGLRIHVREKMGARDLEAKGGRDLSWPGLVPLLGKDLPHFLALKEKYDCGEREIRERIWRPIPGTRKVSHAEDCALGPAGDAEKGWYFSKTKKGEQDQFCSDEHLGRYRLYIESGHGEDDETKISYDVPVDIVTAQYFPSSEGLQVGPSLPNTKGFRDSGSARLARNRVEPLVGGLSVGNERGSAGTLGAVVWDTEDGRPCLLSNWHVLSSVPGAQVGQPCYQPALSDGGDAELDIAGYLKRWIFNRTGDAALADLDQSRYYSPAEVLGLWHPIVEALTPRLGMEVRKWGRASNYTKGFIDGVDLALNVEYREVGVRFYENQIHIAPLKSGEEVSIPGDSGALWVTRAYVSRSREGMLNRLDAPVLKRLERYKPANTDDVLREVQRLLDEANAKLERSGMTAPAADLPAEASAGYTDGPEERGSKKGWLRVYLAVGLHFAGDVPGSPLGEHAVATPITDLARELGFSFRPVFPHPDHCIKPQARFSDPISRGRRRIRGGAGPVRQIDTGFRQERPGPQPDPDPLTGHP